VAGTDRDRPERALLFCPGNPNHRMYRRPGSDVDPPRLGDRPFGGWCWYALNWFVLFTISGVAVLALVAMALHLEQTDQENRWAELHLSCRGLVANAWLVVGVATFLAGCSAASLARW